MLREADFVSVGKMDLENKCGRGKLWGTKRRKKLKFLRLNGFDAQT